MYDEFEWLVADDAEDGELVVRGELWLEDSLVADLTERAEGTTIRLCANPDGPYWEFDLDRLVSSLAGLRQALAVRRAVDWLPAS